MDCVVASLLAKTEEHTFTFPAGISNPSLRAKRSNPWGNEARMDCVVAEPVIGRAFARPVGSSQ